MDDEQHPAGDAEHLQGGVVEPSEHREVDLDVAEGGDGEAHDENDELGATARGLPVGRRGDRRLGCRHRHVAAPGQPAVVGAVTHC